jgi:hypothetical protein
MIIRVAAADVETVRSAKATVWLSDRVAAYGAIEAFSASTSHVVEGPLVHPLWLAFHLAFEEHRPVVLRPDDAWIAIAQGIGRHVAMHAEALRSRFVRSEGKIAIEIRRDELVPGAATNDWPSVVAELALRVRDHVGKRADLFVCNFSTTGPFERTASEIVLLEAVESYFEYTVSTLCGIPEVVLEGTPEDWADVRRRARVIGELRVEGAELDVLAWSRALDLVLEKIEKSARGEIDVDFWKHAYKLESESGGDRTHGWLNAFFPYIAEAGQPPRVNELALDPMRVADAFEGHLLSSFPDGVSQAPFTWDLMGTKIAMELWAGPLGVAQDDATGALRVVHGWAVVRARPSSPFIVRPSPAPWASRVRVARGAAELASLDALSLHANLDAVDLWISGCTKLVDLRGVEHLRRLVSVDATNCTQLRSIEALRGRTEITSVSFMGCTALADVSALETLPNLERVCLMDCTSVTDLRAIKNLSKLVSLVLWRCPAVAEVHRANIWGREAVEKVLASI